MCRVFLPYAGRSVDCPFDSTLTLNSEQSNTQRTIMSQAMSCFANSVNILLIDWTRKNMCDDHLNQSMPLQTTITSDFVAVCAESDIPLEKLRKPRPFLVKHCKQGGALPENESSLCQTHLPGVFDQH
uniref:Uncharacterized protein n=1 Tax=Hucho hucho TaxID=62062 RepID=A0A4W5KEB0_9TELE